MTKETEKLKQEITDLDIDRSNLFKIVDKLENRISKLEKVLESHAKCIGELREDKILARREYERKQAIN